MEYAKIAQLIDYQEYDRLRKIDFKLTPKEEKTLIKLVIQKNDINALNILSERISFCFDRRPLVNLTTNMDIIRTLMDIEYDDDEVIEEIKFKVENGDLTDLKFLLDQVFLEERDFTEIYNLAPDDPEILEILDDYAQKMEYGLRD